MLTTEPAARPYSAANWLVTRRSSCTTSGLLIGCCEPETLGSLLSWPSNMKLFERRRMPLTEKFMRCAKPVWPLPSWLTPAGDNAAFTILRLGGGGNFERVLVSNGGMNYA